MDDRYFWEGFHAREDGLSVCPYEANTSQQREWEDGWRCASWWLN